MKKVYMLEELDCGHCAQRIQDGVSELDGVSKCSVSFLTTKMILEVEEDKLPSVEKKMKEIVKKVSSDINIVSK